MPRAGGTAERSVRGSSEPLEEVGGVLQTVLSTVMNRETTTGADRCRAIFASFVQGIEVHVEVRSPILGKQALLDGEAHNALESLETSIRRGISLV